MTMNLRIYTIFSFFCLLAIGKLGETIKCYSCSSTQNIYCGDDFSRQNFPVLECYGSCIKTRGRDSNNELEINRFCGTTNDDVCHNSVHNNINVNKCWCNTDFCNSATKPFFIPTTFILSFFIFYIFLI